MCKETFQQRCSSILMAHRHRIYSLHLFHHLQIDCLFTSFSLNSSFVQLQALIIDHIKSDHLIDMLISCVSLPSLSSLIVNSIEQIKSPNGVFNVILRLPVLKYCKISLNLREQYDDEPLTTDHYSLIEHLIINAEYNLDDLIDFLTL
ncbi:hypothetical protein DMUE_6264, partial [Dictyocoela muelleri]